VVLVVFLMNRSFIKNKERAAPAFKRAGSLSFSFIPRAGSCSESDLARGLGSFPGVIGKDICKKCPCKTEPASLYRGLDRYDLLALLKGLSGLIIGFVIFAGSSFWSEPVLNHKRLYFKDKIQKNE